MFLGLRRICSGDILDLEKFWRYVPRTWKNLLWGNFGLGKIFALVYFALRKILLFCSWCVMLVEKHTMGDCVFMLVEIHTMGNCVFMLAEKHNIEECVFMFL